MPHVSQGHGDSLDWDRDSIGWWARFYCPKHKHSVTLNGFTSFSGPGETAELNGIVNLVFGGNRINHRCYWDS